MAFSELVSQIDFLFRQDKLKLEESSFSNMIKNIERIILSKEQKGLLNIFVDKPIEDCNQSSLKKDIIQFIDYVKDNNSIEALQMLDQGEIYTNEEEFNNYLNIFRANIDLTSLITNCKLNKYNSMSHFFRDFITIVNNCLYHIVPNKYFNVIFTLILLFIIIIIYYLLILLLDFYFQAFKVSS